jgi:DNA/RNA endonuclease G (NUC1)
LDRGHQVASGDRTASLSDNQATFMMSNISPQSAYLNRRPWVSFERFLRNVVLEQKKEFYIYSGVTTESQGRVGVNRDIAVHARNFKIAVMKPAGNAHMNPSVMRLIIVEMPNVTSTGTSPIKDPEQACYDSQHTMNLELDNREAYWSPYLRTLDEVSESTGLDFEFLRNIPEISADELDEIIAENVQKGFQNSSIPKLIQGAVQSFVDQFDNN